MTNTMKKNYTKPVIEVLTTETELPLATSQDVLPLDVTDDNLVIDINDIQSLFRGGFTSMNDVYYEDNLNSVVGPINITLRGKTDPI